MPIIIPTTLVRVLFGPTTPTLYSSIYLATVAFMYY